MIVEPASIHSRSPLRRLLRAAAFVAPIALFATFLAAGLLGPKPAQDAEVTASASALAVVSSSAAPTPTPASSQPASAIDATVFPATFRARAVQSPSAVIAARLHPRPPRAVIVAGYLAITGTPSRCAAPLITFGAWCDRTGLLFESAEAGGIDATGRRPPHLHVTIPSGVVLPADVAANAGTAAAGSSPVVLVGRFDTPSCSSSTSACDHGFIVDRVVWADGAEVSATALIEPRQGAGLDPSPPELEDAEVLPLVAVLARPATIARLDAAAGAAAQRIPKLTGPVWYVRDVILVRDGALIPRWVLLDARTGTLIATAPLGLSG